MAADGNGFAPEMTTSSRLLSPRAVDALLTIGTLAGLLVLWYWANASRAVSSLLLPAPLAVAEGFITLVTSSFFYGHLFATAFETIVGFALAAVAGILLAVALSQSRFVERIAQPYIVVFQVLPKVALAPVLVIWLGFGFESKIALSAAIAFFPVLVNTMKGIEGVPANAVRLMRSLAASRRQVFTMLTVPVALPYIFAGLRSAATLALIGAVVGEYVTAREGLGKLLVTFSANAQQPLVWATTAVIGALGLLLYGIMILISRRVVWWRA
ncbi:MAG: ABC transporter permease [Chloroflexi bacterium]|nr:ABC transporter permease [Chloroflexota bacterium]